VEDIYGFGDRADYVRHLQLSGLRKAAECVAVVDHGLNISIRSNFKANLSKTGEVGPGQVGATSRLDRYLFVKFFVS
jgi:hypothetical protein